MPPQIHPPTGAQWNPISAPEAARTPGAEGAEEADRTPARLGAGAAAVAVGIAIASVAALRSGLVEMLAPLWTGAPSRGAEVADLPAGAMLLGAMLALWALLLPALWPYPTTRARLLETTLAWALLGGACAWTALRLAGAVTPLPPDLALQGAVLFACGAGALRALWPGLGRAYGVAVELLFAAGPLLRWLLIEALAAKGAASPPFLELLAASPWGGFLLLGAEARAAAAATTGMAEATGGVAVGPSSPWWVGAILCVGGMLVGLCAWRPRSNGDLADGAAVGADHGIENR